MRLDGDRIGAVRCGVRIRRQRQGGSTLNLETGACLSHGQRVQRRVGKSSRRYQIKRFAEHVDSRPELRNAPFGKSGCVAAQQQGLMGLSGRVNEDGARCGEQARQFGSKFLAQFVVEIGQRLVEQNQLGILDNRSCQSRSLLLAARKAEWHAVQIGRQLQQGGSVADRLVDGGLVLAGDTQRRSDVFVDRHRGVVDELLVHHRDVALLYRNASDVLAINKHLA